MCIAAWAETAGIAAAPAGVSIDHVTELLAYDFADSSVQIQLLLIVTVTGTSPVFLHCVHRRCIEAFPSFQRLRRPEGLLDHVVSELGILRFSQAANGGDVVDLKMENGKHLESFLPDGRSAMFCVDDYADRVPLAKAQIPFTSIRFGPLLPSPVAYLLPLSLRINGPAFSVLISVFRNHLSRYMYGIEGPDIVIRDIEAIDLRSLRCAGGEPYSEVYKRGVIDRHVPIRSYDIVTCDLPMDMPEYVRLVRKVEPLRVSQCQTINGMGMIVNSWHSDVASFVIQRVSFLEER